jgi:hypothetical protein
MVSGSRLWYPDQDKWISKSKDMKYYVNHTSLIRAFYVSSTSNDDYEIKNPDTGVLNYLMRNYYASDFTVQRYANKILCPDDDWSVFSLSDKRFLTDTALSIATYIAITIFVSAHTLLSNILIILSIDTSPVLFLLTTQRFLLRRCTHWEVS